jgi:hypothetical protein
MSSNKFLTLVAGVQTLVTAIAASVGVGDANKVVMTDSGGRLDSSLMPSGIGAQTITATATEALVAGDWVNIAPAGVRKADNSNNRPVHGFVLVGVASAATATIHTSGLNTAKTGLTAGTQYFLGTAGAQTTTAPTTAGTIVQTVGVASNSTTIPFDFEPPISIV